MRNGVIYSGILHAAIFFLILFGLPSLFHKKIVEDQVVTVEILPISELTNVKPKKAQKQKLEEKKEVSSPTPPKPSLPDPSKAKLEEKPKPVENTPKVKEETKPVVKEAENKPVKVEEKPKPKEEKKEDKKKEEKKAEDSFAAVLKSVEKLDAKPEEKKEEEKTEDFGAVEDLLSNVKEQPEYKPGIPLSLSEKDAIKQQITKNWTILSGIKDAQNMVVTLVIKLAIDGSVQDVSIKDKVRYGTDQAFRAMADSAVRAVYKSSPLQGLPAEKYDVQDGWREIELNFNPSEMMY